MVFSLNCYFNRFSSLTDIYKTCIIEPCVITVTHHPHSPKELCSSLVSYHHRQVENALSDMQHAKQIGRCANIQSCYVRIISAAYVVLKAGSGLCLLKIPLSRRDKKVKDKGNVMVDDYHQFELLSQLFQLHSRVSVL